MKKRATKKERRKADRRDARVRELEAENAELKARLEKLEPVLAKLQKDSSTSSKPPSSDFVKPAKESRSVGKKRTRGGQPGHPRHERPAFTQGTRALSGREWCERIWTTIATCAQQGRSVLEFLHEAISASPRSPRPIAFPGHILKL